MANVDIYRQIWRQEKWIDLRKKFSGWKGLYVMRSHYFLIQNCKGKRGWEWKSDDECQISWIRVIRSCFATALHWDFPTKQGNISWWRELFDITLSANKWGKVEMGDFWLNFKKFQVHWICSVVKNVLAVSKNEYEHNLDDKWKFQIQQNFVQREGEIAFQKFSKSNLRLKEVVPAKITKTWYFRGWFKICCLAHLF